MGAKFSVSLQKIIDEFSLNEIYMPYDPKDIMVSTTDINRPGLQFDGFFDYFDKERLQIIGKTEYEYINSFSDDQIKVKIDEFMAQKPCGIIITRGLTYNSVFISSAKEYKIPLLMTDNTTSGFMSALIAFLNVELAPRITRHGVLVEVYGEGILILGESGVGKSETAIELIKRGHRLIADDAVEIRKVSDKTLVGTPPENIRHYVELRGVGIINARRIFGMGAVKQSEKIDLVIGLEPWDSDKVYDRMGLETEYMEILGISIPLVTIPVKPGRNLAIIIEVAAMNNRQKKMGYNAAQELLKQLGIDNEQF